MKRNKFRSADDIANEKDDKETVSHRMSAWLIDVLEQEATRVGITRSKLLEGIVKDWAEDQGYTFR